MIEDTFALKPWNDRYLPKSKVIGIQRHFDYTFFRLQLDCGHSVTAEIAESDHLEVGSDYACLECLKSEGRS